MKKLKRTLALALVLCMLCSLFPVSALAAEASAPTTNLSTTGSPFQKGTGESNSFRIPALVTLSDGTLVAAADARWNTTYDGGGLDTMVAVSTDNGANWTHSFANYLGDNDNVHNPTASSCFIDPALAVTTKDANNDGVNEDTVYMLVDLYPNGVALNGGQQRSPSTQTGFNDAGKLVLTTVAPSSSDYASSDFTHYLDNGSIYANDGTVVDGLSVDDHFNVTGTYNGATVDSNLFFADSPFHVARTGYLYLTKSTNGGESWSAPQLLNLKTTSEMVCLVGPGRGLVTSNGTIVFPIYSYNGSESSQRTGFIYSNDEGATWNRVDGSISWSSESAVVELWDGTLRFFYRNSSSQMCYADYNMSTSTWSSTYYTGIATNSNTQISAISLQQTIDEQQVILVSCPAGPSGGSNSSSGSQRVNGKIFLFTVNEETNAMTKRGEVSIDSQHSTTNYFMYSCLSALTDEYGNETGDIAILYEDNENNYGTSATSYYEMSFETVKISDFGVTTDEDSDTDIEGETPLEAYEKDVILKLGETFNETVEGIYVESGEDEDDIVSYSWVGTNNETEELTAANVPTSAGSIECYISDGNGNYLSLSNGALVNVTDIANATKWTVTYYDHSNSMARYKITSGGYYVRLANSTLAAGTDDSYNAHYYSAENGFFCSSNGSNVWIYNNGWTVGSSGDNNAKAYTLETVTTEDPKTTEVTITPKTAGKTTVELGNGAISYNVTVNSTASNIVDVELKLGETKTYTEKLVNHANSSSNVNPNSNIAGMELTGSDGVYTKGTFVAIDGLTAGSYIIKNSRAANNGAAGTLVSNTPNSSNNDGLKLEGTESSFGASAVWTITPVGENTYTIRDINGKYMTIGNSTAGVSADETILNFTYTSSNMKYAISKDGYYLNQFGGDTSTRAAGWNGSGASTDDGSMFEIYQFSGKLPSTEITFNGVSLGKTVAVVGDTQYNITVVPANTVNVHLTIGESKTYTDETGNYQNYAGNVQPNASIATMTVTGVAGVTETTVSTEKTTELEAGATYIIRVFDTNYALSSNSGRGDWGTTTRAFEQNNLTANEKHLWTLEAAEGGYKLKSADGYLSLGTGNNAATLGTDGEIFTITYTDTGWTIGNQSGRYINALGGLTSYYTAGGWTGDGTRFDLYKVTEVTPASTSITFQGVSTGTTTAVVGNTLYNITVTPAGMTTVDIELEIGESFTYTDTTGNHVDNVTQQPDGTYATMAVSGSTNTVQKVLVPVTASTFQTGKRYVIENVRAANPNHAAYQPNDSVLTSTVVTGGATGLDMNGPLDANTSQTWTFTPNDNMYYVGRDNSYITLNGSNAYMSTSAQSLSFEYVDGSGWLIYYNADGNNTSNDGDYFLSDVYGTGSGEAFGYTDKDDDGNYWNIYEVVDEQQIDATRVTFIGVAEGKTTAIVGNTLYSITVVPAEVDDEVMNSATDIWTVDPEIQRNRYNTIINGKYKDLYTDESWKEYEAARQKAYKKLVEVTNAEYDSKADADAALAELTALVDALDAAAKKLVAATTISVHYTYNDADLDIREYKIASTDTSVTLPDTIVVGDIAYKVTDTTLDRQGAETTYYVPVTLIGKVGEGFVGSQDLNIGTHNNHPQIADLVDDDGNGKKITEMTVTVGISYDLDLGIEMLDGYTVEWVSDNTNIVTVDQDGNVTAVGEGITNITATVKDADGNIVEVNSIPVTVFPTGTDDRNTAIYIEEVTNTTVWCVVNANTNTYGFEVIEGELIYGQFDTTVSDGTKTTAMSFFGDPDEAHALVYMKSTNSDDHYFLLHDDDGNLYDGTVTPNANYYVSGQTSGAGYWQAVGLCGNQTGADTPGWSTIKDMVQWAIDLGCDGGLGFTRRQTEGDLASNLSFKSDPMPRIEKVVDGVLPTTRKQANYRRYVDDMVAAVHELVYFKITVTQEVPTEWQDADQTVGEIEYTNAWVKDTVLPGAYLYTKELDQADGTWDGEISDGVDANGEPFRKQQIEITDQLNEAWTAEQKEAGKRVFEFYLMYEIQESDIPKFYIDNIANLDYNYDSKYSTGAQAAAADAEARISVVGSAIDNVVIDFGQSFTYEGHEFESYTDGKTYTFTGLSNVHLKGAFVDGEYDAVGKFTDVNADGSKMVSGAAAKYGEVKVYRTNTGSLDDKGNPEYIYTVEYTPTAILQEADAVRIYGIGENDQEKLINGFLVYPATTVYYEEGFLEKVSGWNFDTAKMATTEQTFELLGVSQFDNHGTLTGYVSNKKQAYGFDPIYDGISDNGEVVSSSISATTPGAAAKFTFTGTGFEIFANCTEDSGYVLVTVTDKDGNNVKMFTVNTVVKGGTGENNGATVGQTGNMDALPIVSLKDLEHGTYTVTLTKVVNDGKTVTIDGVRITNTISDSSIYTVDLEDSPEFYQLRDTVLNAIGIFPETSKDYIDPSMLEGKTNEEIEELLRSVIDVVDFEKTASQVYNSMLVDSDSEAPSASAVITDPSVIYGENAEIQDLLDNGPKNEIYLWPNQTLTFKVATQRVIQVGLKAPSGATGFDCTIRDDLTDTPAYVGGGVYGATDMFYYLTNKPVENIDNTYVVSITNIGSSVLAITDLKVCDDPNAAFVPLTLEDVTNILIDAGYTNSQPQVPTNPVQFKDVPMDAYYYESVLWAVENGVTTGTTSTTFSPDMVVTRAQAVTFLWAAAGKPEPIGSNPFTDVAEDDWFYKAVLWANENGITSGVGDGCFAPNDVCTREQVVTFLYAFKGKPTFSADIAFTDVQPGAWYYNAVAWAAANHVTSGMGNGNFGVGVSCTRAQMVTFLHAIR